MQFELLFDFNMVPDFCFVLLKNRLKLRRGFIAADYAGLLGVVVVSISKTSLLALSRVAIAPFVVLLLALLFVVLLFLHFHVH